MRTELVSPLLAIPLFWLCLCNNLFLVSGLCPQDQRSLLLQLKNNLTFTIETSNKLKSWNPSNDCCGWVGVKCDKEGHVTALDLCAESITGGFGNSGSLFSPQHLHKLNFAYNYFNSVIASAFKRLGNLTYLNLSCAGFLGRIPIEISQMTRLVTLDLSSLLCPTEQELNLGNPNLRKLVRNLTSIRQLYLDGLSGSIPSPHFEGLNNLVSFDLSNNSVSGSIPSSLFPWCLMKMSNTLELLNLRKNSLMGSVPDKFSAVCALRTLNLRQNKLDRKIPKSLSDYTSLEVLDLGENKIMDVSSNHFEGEIPEQLFEFKALYALNLSNNAFWGKIPQSIRNLKEVESLDLSKNSLEGNIRTELASLSFLSVLNHSFSDFVGEIPTDTQFQIFLASSIRGNDGLRRKQRYRASGVPLTEEVDGTEPVVLQEHQTTVSTIDWNFIIVEVGVIFGHGMIFYPLLFWKQWRIWYWKVINKILCWIFPQLYFEYVTKRGQTYATLRWQH